MKPKLNYDEIAKYHSFGVLDDMLDRLNLNETSVIDCLLKHIKILEDEIEELDEKNTYLINSLEG